MMLISEQQNQKSGLGDITGYPAFASGVKSVNVT
jgi:hypothetical protein